MAENNKPIGSGFDCPVRFELVPKDYIRVENDDGTVSYVPPKEYENAPESSAALTDSPDNSEPESHGIAAGTPLANGYHVVDGNIMDESGIIIPDAPINISKKAGGMMDGNS